MHTLRYIGMQNNIAVVAKIPSDTDFVLLLLEAYLHAMTKDKMNNFTPHGDGWEQVPPSSLR